MYESSNLRGYQHKKAQLLLLSTKLLQNTEDVCVDLDRFCDNHIGVVR